MVVKTLIFPSKLKSKIGKTREKITQQLNNTRQQQHTT